MVSVLDEARKHRAFREPWIAYLLGGLYLLISLHMYADSFQTVLPSQNWTLIQQDIRSYGATVTAFLLCIGLPRLVCCEREWRTDSLIRTTDRGCFDTWRAKTLYTVLYCGLVVLAVGGTSLLVQGGTFSFQGALSPVAKCFYFSDDALPPMANILYCILQYAFLYLGALYYAGFVLLVAALTKRTALTVFLCGASYLICMVYAYTPYVFSGSLRVPFGVFYYFGFGGYLLQDSYSWNPHPGWGNWSDLWKPLLIVICMIALEFFCLQCIMRRRARR